MSNDEQELLTLRLSGVDTDGNEISSANMPCSLIVAHLKLLRDLASDVPDLRVGIEQGSILTNLLLPLLVYTSISTDYDRYAQGDYNSIEPKRLKTMQELDKKARKYNLTLEVRGQGKEIYNSSKANAILKDVTYESEETMELAGIVLDAGGQSDKPNIHIENRKGKYTVTATKEQLKAIPYNILYQEIRVVVSYKYNIRTKVQRDYRLKEIIETEPITEEDCKEIIKKESEAWKDVEDIGRWILNLRGEE